MKRSRFSEEQIAYALRLAESGTPVVDVCRQIGVSEATYYTWEKNHHRPHSSLGHLTPSEFVRKRSDQQLERRPTPV
jgi:transposase-like protein